jgi:hypothetical protein
MSNIINAQFFDVFEENERVRQLASEQVFVDLQGVQVSKIAEMMEHRERKDKHILSLLKPRNAADFQLFLVKSKERSNAFSRFLFLSLPNR